MLLQLVGFCLGSMRPAAAAPCPGSLALSRELKRPAGAPQQLMMGRCKTACRAPYFPNCIRWQEGIATSRLIPSSQGARSADCWSGILCGGNLKRSLSCNRLHSLEMVGCRMSSHVFRHAWMFCICSALTTLEQVLMYRACVKVEPL